MKTIILFSAFCFTTTIVFAQKQTYDLVSYTPPSGWKTEVKTNMTAYTKTDKKKNKWCQVFIVKSTISKGSIEADFESEWQDLAVKNYNPSEAPVCRDTELADGWKVKT